MLRRARRLLRRAGDAPVLLDADMEAALNGVQLLRTRQGSVPLDTAV